jgi:lysophospholipid acyltransferase (LPLAT)-like uncharacterized protein
VGLMRTLFFYIGYFYYLILVKTAKIKLIGFENVQAVWKSGRNVVFCCPHNAILACFVGVDSMVRPNVVLIASLSGDGELISKLLLKRRFEMIRGSSSRGAKRALVELQNAGKLGKSLGIAFDGPKGPPFVPKRGIIGCARVVNGPLFFIHAHALNGRFFGFPKSFRVNSWDRFLVPLPFCEIAVHFEKIPEMEELNITDNYKYEEYVLKEVEKKARDVYSNIYKK